MFNDNIEFFNYLDKVEIKSLKKINLLIEMSKSQYKSKLQEDIKKKYFKNANYVVESTVTSTISKKLFDSIDELNILAYKDVGEYYYNAGVKQVEEFYKDESKKVIQKEYTDEVLGGILASFIAGRGLNYTYSQELKRRMDYFNTQMVNTSMAIINKKIQAMDQKEINGEYKKIISSNLDLSDELMNDNLKVQKRGVSHLVDSTGVFVAVGSLVQAYIDNGIEMSIRHAEVDDRTCDYCLENDGRVYEVGTEEMVSHNGCRCWYEPYSVEDEE